MDGKKMHLPSWHPQFETPPALIPGCESSSTLCSSSPPRLLCHTSCCCIQRNHCLGPTLLTISALQSFLLLIMTQTGQLLHITDTFNMTVKAHVHLQNWMKDAMQRLEHFCLWVHRWCLWKCVWNRQTTLETKINNIWTNYIQYIVGDPLMWYKILLLHGQTLLIANARPQSFISSILYSA